MADFSLKYNTDKGEFYKVLHKRVNEYFKSKGINRHANSRMVIKTTVMLSLYFLPLIYILFGSVSHTGLLLGLWATMGVGMSGIGLSVMHDANHGSYSSNKTVNYLLGFVLNFLGGYHNNWKIQHNVLHHSYPNVDGYDDDIFKPGVFRLSPSQPRSSHFKFQAFYAPLLYSIMSIYWFLWKDFEQLKRYKERDLLKTQGITFSKGVFWVLFHKIWYVALTLVLPILVTPLPWWQNVLGFVIMHVMTGLALALIFQAAHVIEETHFFEPIEGLSLENNWAIHQMKTTANFARTNEMFSWFIGGLNFQIEHHLFPNICHVHYRKLSKIVKSTAAEFNIPYYEHTTFLQALKSHFSLLHKLGTGSYDHQFA